MSNLDIFVLQTRATAPQRSLKIDMMLTEYHRNHTNRMLTG